MNKVHPKRVSIKSFRSEENLSIRSKRSGGSGNRKRASQSRQSTVGQVFEQPKSDVGPSIRAVLPQIINEQNRKKFGTWQRQFDFTRTLLGYMLGIHNFFRFPYLCYKFGGIFFIPYIIMMALVGVPIVFMEFTIGQYCGVGSYVAFTHMAPILNGVSKLLTWSCVVNCWMYTMIMAWLRIYSNDSTSCLKGWETCHQHHYYNTPNCWTGEKDDDCNDPFVNPQALTTDMLYYNFKCRDVKYYCEQNGWEEIVGERKCRDSNGKEHTIYERRYHATMEFYYGAVCGIKRKMDDDYKKNMIIETQRETGKTLEEIRQIIYVGEPLKLNSSTDVEAVEEYLRELQTSDKAKFENILEQLITPAYQKEYWEKANEDGSKFINSLVSSSYTLVQEVSVTTWIMIAVFLFEDLLKISFLSYVLNAVPFVMLVYVTMVSVFFDYSGHGIQQLFKLKNGWWDLIELEMWAEAVVQVIYTTGIGNGVLISLATFNNFSHSYLFDLFCTLGLSIITSCCGVLICFCSLGHYLKFHNINVPFRDYIRSESASSVEFCFIMYSHFLTLINDRNIATIMFYFMFTSFATDTAVRLTQNVIDTLMAVSPRLKHQSTMVLIAVCLMGYLMLVPTFRNGGIVLYIDFEYFTLRYMVPTIILIQVGAAIFVYKASRLADNAEQMQVFTNLYFRKFIIGSMYFSFVALLFAVIINVSNHSTTRFNGDKTENFGETFGWVFFSSPLLMAVLSIVKQLIVVPANRWWWLVIPLMGKDRKLRRAFLRRIQGGKPGKDRREDETEHEAVRSAALRWRTLEARLLLAMMAKRKEEQEKKAKAEAAAVEQAKSDTADAATEQDAKRQSLESKRVGSTKEIGDAPALNQPLFASLVRVARESQLAGLDDDNNIETGEEKTDKRNSNQSDNDKNAQDDKSLFNYVKAVTFWSKFKLAFWGKATHGQVYPPKRHVGGQGHTRIVTKTSADGSRSVTLSEELDKHSVESMSQGEIEEKSRLRYLDFMDYIERWPGRLDEEEIESEGSSVEEEDIEDDDERF